MFKKIVFSAIFTLVISIFFVNRISDFITNTVESIFISNDDSSISKVNTFKMYTKEQLKLYNGIDKPELYLSLLGNVFDVTKGAKHYGPEGHYNFFVGCDASRSFITGKFNKEESRDDVADLNVQDLRSLKHWLNFYEKEYVKIGKLIGRYYDDIGNVTPYGKIVRKLIKEAEHTKETENIETRTFPPCNVEWSPDKGTRVWCSKKSGGIERDWIGVPRQFYATGSKTYRCACINKENVNFGNIKLYDNCNEESKSCYIGLDA